MMHFRKTAHRVNIVLRYHNSDHNIILSILFLYFDILSWILLIIISQSGSILNMAPVDARKKLEQIRRNKNKNVGNNVRDLRQLIAKKKKPQGTSGNSSKLASSRALKGRLGSDGFRPKDLRETNKKLSSRKNLSQSRDNNRIPNKNDRVERFSQGTSRSLNSTINNQKRSIGSSSHFKSGIPSIQYYIPPHLQQQQQQQPTYIIASAPAPAPQSNLAMDNVPEVQGASILISNLMPSITQSEIIELFGDIGVMTAVNMINQTTALVTYQNSSDAVRAVKVYHNRLLDGKPMLVNMMPNSTPASNVRSRVGHSSVIGNHPAGIQLSYAGRRT